MQKFQISNIIHYISILKFQKMIDSARLLEFLSKLKNEVFI